MERFHTLQGEGNFTGSSAYFIRLAGCDVGCVWCDVKESWDKNLHPEVDISILVKEAKESNPSIVVITGGEPLMYDLSELTQKIKDEGLQINIETSGAHPLTGEFDWICLSPKKFKNPLPEIYEKANELKIIVYNQHDFVWAQEEASKVGQDCKLFLQPEWSKEAEMIPKIIAFVKENPKWRISLQTHKYMNIP
jgi:organic radical activating enzyme